MVHYEVIVYEDGKRQDGKVMAFTQSQEWAAQYADRMRAAGYTAVDIKRFGQPEETPTAAPGGA